ncbi:YvbH-like oligomerization domain-containing protein [Gracilibacillus alcaliphilus]|nr:YvbH-like oligomerization domain-containing protein [Gracilibacillus alcaliphilus]
MFEKATKFAFDWLNTTYDDNTRKDFGDIFNKYIQN